MPIKESRLFRPGFKLLAISTWYGTIVVGIIVTHGELRGAEHAHAKLVIGLLLIFYTLFFAAAIYIPFIRRLVFVDEATDTDAKWTFVLIGLFIGLLGCLFCLRAITQM